MSRPSPLQGAHRQLSARLVEFAGWQMPLQFAGILAEHRAVRNQAGLFDVSHLGKILVSGTGAPGALDRVLTGKVASLAPGRAAYNLVLNESGGIRDDVFVYRLPESSDLDPFGIAGRGEPEGFLVVPNAANAEAVYGCIAEALPNDVAPADLHSEVATLAISGPRSREIVARKLPDVAGLKLHELTYGSFDDIPVMAARTGYTGELTFELFVQAASAEGVWRALLDLGEPFGLSPAGLGARDLLRLEMGYPLHGADITQETNPIEAGLGWAVDWEKKFFGKPALEEIRRKGPSRRLTGLVGRSRRIPRAGSSLVWNDEEAGFVTSGNFSPSLDAGIALGYLQADLAAEGETVEARVGTKSMTLEVKTPPFIKRKAAATGGKTPGSSGRILV